MFSLVDMQKNLEKWGGVTMFQNQLSTGSTK